MCSVQESHHARKLKLTSKKDYQTYKTIASESSIALFTFLKWLTLIETVSFIYQPPKKGAWYGLDVPNRY